MYGGRCPPCFYGDNVAVPKSDPPEPTSMPNDLILLHGLWMRGITLAVLQRRLERVGYRVETLDYMSVATPFEQTLDSLRQRMRRHADGVHVVGHSLGGLLALLAIQGDDSLPPGRVVCMASPLTGSAIARQLSEHGGAWMLGHSRRILEHGLAHWDGSREVGMVAGCTGVGLGTVMGHLEGESDGTVAVEETRLPGLTDHCVVETSHTGMLLSRSAAAQAVAFLQHGRFRQDAS